MTKNRHNKRSFARMRKERFDLRDLQEESRGVKRKSCATFEAQTPSRMGYEQWQEDIENKIDQAHANEGIWENVTVYDNSTETDPVETKHVGTQVACDQTKENCFSSIFANGVANRLQFGRPVIPVGSNKPFDLSKSVDIELNNHKWRFSNVKQWGSASIGRIDLKVNRLAEFSLDSYAVMHVLVKLGDTLVATEDFSLSETSKEQTLKIKAHENDDFGEDEDVIKILGWFDIIYTNCVMNQFGTEIKFADPGRSHDVVITVDGQKFYLHKIYLATWSKYFDRLFADRRDGPRELTLPFNDVKAEEFFMLMELIHPNRLRPINDASVLFLLKLGDRFEMPSVLSMCGEYLCNFENKKDIDIIDRLKIADKHKLENLLIVTLNAIRNQHKFGNLVADNWGRLQMLSENTKRSIFPDQ